MNLKGLFGWGADGVRGSKGEKVLLLTLIWELGVTREKSGGMRSNSYFPLLPIYPHFLPLQFGVKEE